MSSSARADYLLISQFLDAVFFMLSLAV